MAKKVITPDKEIEFCKSKLKIISPNDVFYNDGGRLISVKETDEVPHGDGVKYLIIPGSNLLTALAADESLRITTDISGYSPSFVKYVTDTSFIDKDRWVDLESEKLYNDEYVKVFLDGELWTLIAKSMFGFAALKKAEFNNLSYQIVPKPAGYFFIRKTFPAINEGYEFQVINGFHIL